MNLTSDGKRMLDWAQNNYSLEECRKVFTPIDESMPSYYEKRNEREALIYEFDFDDFPQIKACFEKLWQDDPVMQDMVLISAVSAMKHRPNEQKQTEVNPAFSKASDGEFEIPEYVYVF